MRQILDEDNAAMKCIIIAVINYVYAGRSLQLETRRNAFMNLYICTLPSVEYIRFISFS